MNSGITAFEADRFEYSVFRVKLVSQTLTGTSEDITQGDPLWFSPDPGSAGDGDADDSCYVLVVHSFEC